MTNIERKILLQLYKQAVEQRRASWKNYQKAKQEQSDNTIIEMYNKLWTQRYEAWHTMHDVLTVLNINHEY